MLKSDFNKVAKQLLVCYNIMIVTDVQPGIFQSREIFLYQFHFTFNTK